MRKYAVFVSVRYTDTTMNMKLLLLPQRLYRGKLAWLFLKIKKP